MKIHPVGAELYHENRRTVGHNEVNGRFSQLCESTLITSSFYWHNTGGWGGAVDKANRLRNGQDRGSKPARDFLISETSRPDHPASSSMGTGGSLPGVKWLERDVYHSPPSSAEIKNKRKYNSTPTLCLHGMYGKSLHVIGTIRLHWNKKKTVSKPHNLSIIATMGGRRSVSSCRISVKHITLYEQS